MNFASRWVVVREHPVGPDDVDSKGVVRTEAVERWLEETRTAYFEKCIALRELQERLGLQLRARVYRRSINYGLHNAVVELSEVGPNALDIDVQKLP
jgi:acyl-CoA thioesterase FadM